MTACFIGMKSSNPIECNTCKKQRCQIVEVKRGNSKRKKKITTKQFLYSLLTPSLQRLFITKERQITCGRMKFVLKTEFLGIQTLKHRRRFLPRMWIFLEMLETWLVLSTEGSKPFKHWANHSIWLVILVLYKINIPPSMSMKQPYFIMLLFILGSTSLVNGIDFSCIILIYELKELCSKGDDIYDAHMLTTFCMYTASLWTISEFS